MLDASASWTQLPPPAGAQPVGVFVCRNPFSQDCRAMYVKIIRACAVRGRHVSVGEVIEVDSDTANHLIHARRGVVAEQHQPKVSPIETRDPQIESRDPEIEPSKRRGRPVKNG